MNAHFKKSLKIVTLLLTAIIIATVSAATYSELFMYGSNITIGTAAVQFTAGDDTATLGGGNAINTAGTAVTFDNVPTITPGQTVTYPEAVNITNSAGASKTITITVESLTGDFDTNFDYLYITMVAGNGTTLGTRIEELASGTDVTTTGAVGMQAAEVWAISWSLKAKTDATVGQFFSITLKVRVD